MLIAENMNLDALAKCMGKEKTRAEADAMRELLVERFDGQDTQDVPDANWLTMLSWVANA